MLARRRRKCDGSVYRRSEDGRWVADVTVGRIGKKQVRRVKFAPSKKTARKKQEEIWAELENAASPEAAATTLKEYLLDWLSSAVKTGVRESTFAFLEHDVKKNIIPYLGKNRLCELSPMLVQAFYARLHEEGKSAYLRKHAHAHLRWALNDAIAEGILYRNPCKYVRVPNTRIEAAPCPSLREVKRLLKVARDDRYYALLVLAITTGMRPGELAGLRWSDIDWNTATLSVQRSLVNVRGKLKIAPTKTESSRRKIEMPSIAVKALREHRRRWQAMGIESESVFTSPRGKPFRRESYYEATLYPLLKRAKIPRFKFRSLRNFTATILTAEGVHPRIVADRLGHARTSITLDRYAHVIPGIQKEAARKIERFATARGLASTPTVPRSLP